jgi:hypothetical protein
MPRPTDTESDSITTARFATQVSNPSSFTIQAVTLLFQELSTLLNPQQQTHPQQPSLTR